MWRGEAVLQCTYTSSSGTRLGVLRARNPNRRTKRSLSFMSYILNQLSSSQLLLECIIRYSVTNTHIDVSEGIVLL